MLKAPTIHRCNFIFLFRVDMVVPGDTFCSALRQVHSRGWNQGYGNFLLALLTRGRGPKKEYWTLLHSFRFPVSGLPDEETGRGKEHGEQGQLHVNVLERTNQSPSLDQALVPIPDHNHNGV